MVIVQTEDGSVSHANVIQFSVTAEGALLVADTDANGNHKFPVHLYAPGHWTRATATKDNE